MNDHYLVRMYMYLLLLEQNCQDTILMQCISLRSFTLSTHNSLSIFTTNQFSSHPVFSA